MLITKFFQLLGKTISFIFIYLIKKPLFFIFNFLLYKKIVKLYHWYRKKYCLKRKKETTEKELLKEDLEKSGEKIFGHKDLKFGKNYNRFFVVITILLLVSYQYIYTHSAKASTDIHQQAIVTELISNKFNNLTEEEELIEESFSQESLMLDINFSQIDKYNQALKPEKRISEKETLNNDTLVDIPLNKVVTLKSDSSDSSTNTTTNNSSDSTNKRTETIEYTVKPGDNVSSIAKKFGISVNTILWENNLSSRSLLGVGDKLTILPFSGISHKVSSGENLSYIANIYDVEVSDILKSNNLSSTSKLQIGQKLIIEGGVKRNTYVATNTTRNSSTGIGVIKDLVSPAPAKVNSSDKMLWPTEGHRITQYYSWGHKGLDIANKTGTPLYAADSGKVIWASWSTGYGYNVLLDHGNGVKTRYAHASKLYVKVGDKVEKGEAIAAMGSTGWSTGPHIHFEVIINNVKKNPLNYIQ